MERLPETRNGGWVSVVGAGNWLVPNDSVGPRVLELIKDRYGSDVELCEAGSAGLALLDFLHGQDLMIVVDACTLGGTPGEIHEIEPDWQAPPSNSVSVHQIGPFETLNIAQKLYPQSLPHRVLLVLVETDGIDTEQQEQTCHQVVSILDREIGKWRRARLSEKGTQPRA